MRSRTETRPQPKQLRRPDEDREHNSGLLGSEPFPDLGEDTATHEVKLAAVEHLVDLGEQVLVFEETRSASVGTALQLAERLRLPMAEAALQTLVAHEETIASRHLRATLESSVAFHNADLAPARSGTC